MVVRLGFAVATALRPDILITDEVLAVGDESFQKKCIAWMEAYLADGGTLLLCSHSMYHIQKLCRARAVAARRQGRALWPRDGRHAGLSRIPRGEVGAGAASRSRPPSPRAAGVYAVQSLDDRARRDAGAGRDARRARRGVLAGRPRARRADRHRARRRHAGLRRGDRHGGRGAARASTRTASRSRSRCPISRCCPASMSCARTRWIPKGVRLFDHVERTFVVTGASREMGFVRLPHRWQLSRAGADRHRRCRRTPRRDRLKSGFAPSGVHAIAPAHADVPRRLSMSPDLEFTGERFVPGIAGEIAHEHWHRYAFARRSSRASACSTSRAAKATAARCCAGAAAESSASTSPPRRSPMRAPTTRTRANLRFEQGSATALPLPMRRSTSSSRSRRSSTCRATTSRAMLAEIARVLTRRRRAACCRRPTRSSTREARNYRNPFHLHEPDARRARRACSRRVPGASLVPAAPLLRFRDVERGCAGAIAAKRGPAAMPRRRGRARPPAAMYLRRRRRARRRGAAGAAGRGAVAVRRSRRGGARRGSTRRRGEVLRLDGLLRERDAALDRQTAHVRHLEELVAERERRSSSRARMQHLEALVALSRAQRRANATRNALRRTPTCRRLPTSATRSASCAVFGAAGDGRAARRRRPARARDRRAGADHRVPAERALVAGAAVAARARCGGNACAAHDERAAALRASTSSSRCTTRRTTSARCVDSVLAHLRPDVRLVLIDDASPDPRIAALFAELEQRAHPQVVLLRNDGNLGFTGTANRGMQLSRADVVLLNSDTIVTRRLARRDHALRGDRSRASARSRRSPTTRRSARSRASARTIRGPRTRDPEPVRAALAAAAVPTYPDLPTGVGFCMYVRRALLDDVGAVRPGVRPGLRRGERPVPRAPRAPAGATCSPTTRSSCTRAAGPSPGRRRARRRATWRCCSSAIRTTSTWCARYIAADPLRPLRDAASMRAWRSTRRPGAACCT